MDEFCNQNKIKEKRNEVMLQIQKDLIKLIKKDISILEAIRDYIDDNEKEISYVKEANSLSSLIDIYCNLNDIDISLTNIKVSKIYQKAFEED